MRVGEIFDEREEERAEAYDSGHADGFNDGYDEGFDDGYYSCLIEIINRIFSEIEGTTWYHIHNGKLVEGSSSEHESLYKASDIFKVLAKYGYSEDEVYD